MEVLGYVLIHVPHWDIIGCDDDEDQVENLVNQYIPFRCCAYLLAHDIEETR